MAKSLRSKTKRHYRAVKRTDPKSDYKLAEDIRLSRLNTALKKSALKPRALTDKEEWERKQEGFETDEEEEDGTAHGEQSEKQGEEGGMEVDGTASTSTAEPPKKVSTSGPRLSRRESYRASKGFTVKQTPTTQFRARGEKKRMACKPQRRR
ncbi:hypothetical protein JCM1841_005741 [Sporobolomyces salmonicolor]